MSNFFGLESFSMNFPYIFLCGPNSTKKERRTKLQTYIIKNTKIMKSSLNIFQFMPIIIDDILENTCSENKINLHLLEEIISIISYKTYIFLDTMSTSYELGMFTNTFIKETDVLVFLPENYAQKKRIPIGEYITKNLINSSQLITYECDIKKDTENISFKNNQEIPVTIQEELSKAFKTFFKGPFEIKFIEKSIFSTEIDFFSIEFMVLNKEISFNMSLKTYVYFYLYIFSTIKSFDFATKINKYYKLKGKKHKKADLNKVIESLLEIISENSLNKEDKNNHIMDSIREEVEKIIYIQVNSQNFEASKKFMEILFNSFILSKTLKKDYSFCFSYYSNLFNNKIFIGAQQLDQENTISLNAMYLFEKIYRYNIQMKEQKYFIGKNDFKFSRIHTPQYSEKFFTHYNFFGLLANDFKIINKYINNPDSFVDKFWMTIKGKKKKIITYSKNSNGNQLRIIHNILNSFFKLNFPDSHIAIAYKEGSTISNSLQIHNSSDYFEKYDIKHFFDSIKLKNFKKELEYFLVEKDGWYKEMYNNKCFMSQLSLVLQCCFYNDKLPIGYICSPKISNIFMHRFDEIIEKKIKNINIKCSRYADDFLFSCSYDNPNFSDVKKYFLKEIENMNLTINDKKTSIRHFNHPGDSIKFLGICIVKNNNLQNNRFKISNSYIVKVSKFISKVDKEKKYSLNFEKAIGMVNYVESISKESYKKLNKILSVHSISLKNFKNKY